MNMKFKQNDVVVCETHYIFDGNNLSRELIIGNLYKIIDIARYNKDYGEVYVEHSPSEFEWFKDTCFKHITEYRDNVIEEILK